MHTKFQSGNLRRRHHMVDHGINGYNKRMTFDVRNVLVYLGHNRNQWQAFVNTVLNSLYINY